MTTFVAISGPSLSGKSSIYKAVRSELVQKNRIKFLPDIKDKVWNGLVSRRIFQDFSDITTDNSYLCSYIIKLIDYYEEIMKDEYDKSIVFIDDCWLDIFIYAAQSVWYNHIIKEVQETIFQRIGSFCTSVSRIYITNCNDEEFPEKKISKRGASTNIAKNRKSELQYYEIAKNFRNTVALPSCNEKEAVKFILNDLETLGEQLKSERSI